MVRVEDRIITISLAIVISVSLRMTNYSERFRCMRFTTKAMVSCAFHGNGFSVTYDEAKLRTRCLRVAITFPVRYAHLYPVFLVRTVVCHAFRWYAIANVDAQRMMRLVRLIRHLRISGRVGQRYVRAMLHVPIISQFNGIRRAIRSRSSLEDND